MAKVLLGLGSNVGKPVDNLSKAIGKLSETASILQVSSLYRSEPVGYANQDWFLNCALVAETSLQPQALLERILEIETLLGRVRTIRNGPRTIDIDILLYDGLQLEGPPLTVPHPRMHERAFVLRPAAEIAPAWQHPLLRLSIKTLSEILPAAEKIERFNAPAWPPRATS